MRHAGILLGSRELQGRYWGLWPGSREGLRVTLRRELVKSRLNLALTSADGSR